MFLITATPLLPNPVLRTTMRAPALQESFRAKAGLRAMLSLCDIVTPIPQHTGGEVNPGTPSNTLDRTLLAKIELS